MTFWLWLTTIWLMSTWHSAMVEEEKFLQCKISTNTMYNTLKTHTKYVHSICSRPTIKDVQHFQNGSVRKPFRGSLYEWPFIEKHVISTKLSDVNWEKHKHKSCFFFLTESSSECKYASRLIKRHFKWPMKVKNTTNKLTDI